MSHLTKRQHYVPRSYLQLWSNESGQLVGHDLVSGESFVSSPKGLLNMRYFYEENRADPDNRVENILSRVESYTVPVFKKMDAILSRHSTNPSNAATDLRRELTNQDADNLACFSALQYLRVPDAIAQKRRELQASDITENELDCALNPGRFTLSGYDYVRDRFRQMKLMLMISPGREFITSDRPCFDMKDSDNAPLLGEEIGQDPQVVCYLPITPRMGAVFYPVHFSADSPAAPKFTVRTVADSLVKNQNTLVVQQAARYVVAMREETYIFKIAAKRKRGRTND